MIKEVLIYDKGNLGDFEYERLMFHFSQFSERYYPTFEKLLDSLKPPLRQSLYFVGNQIDFEFSSKIKIENENNKSRFVRALSPKKTQAIKKNLICIYCIIILVIFAIKVTGFIEVILNIAVLFTS